MLPSKVANTPHLQEGTAHQHWARETYSMTGEILDHDNLVTYRLSSLISNDLFGGKPKEVQVVIFCTILKTS